MLTTYFQYHCDEEDEEGEEDEEEEGWQEDEDKWMPFTSLSLCSVQFNSVSRD